MSLTLQVGPVKCALRAPCAPCRVSNIHMVGGQSVLKGANGREYLLEEEQRGDEVGRVGRAVAHAPHAGLRQKMQEMEGGTASAPREAAPPRNHTPHTEP